MSTRNAVLPNAQRAPRPAAQPPADRDRSGRSPVGTALVMLAVYVTMYLTVAGVLHLLEWVQP